MREHFYSLTSFLTLSLFLSLFLSACEVGGEKRKIESNDSILVSYFFSEQYAINDEFYRNLFSFIYGGIGAADPKSSTRFWTQPPSGCVYSQQLDTYQWQQFGLRRLINAGTLYIEDSALARQELKLNGLESIMSYYFLSPLQAGVYKLISPGVSGGALQFQQNFTVLNSGSNLRSHRYDSQGNLVESRSLASPNIPDENDPSYRIILDRLSHNALSFSAPEGTDYVKARIKDGSNTSGGDITCFAQPDEVLLIPKGALYSFRTTTQAYLELDFVKVSSVSNVNRLKHGIFVSATRHIQGTFEYTDKDGVKHTENVGLTEIR
jgi:hypothetical protein